jgi:hypothetical protein
LPADPDPRTDAAPFHTCAQPGWMNAASVQRRPEVVDIFSFLL